MKKEISVLVGGHSTEFDASILSYEHVVITCSSQDSPIIVKEVFFINGDKIHVYSGSEIPLLASGLGKNGKSYPFSELANLLTSSKYYKLSLLHGNEGEDGCIQGMANMYGWKGSFGDVLVAALSMNKWQMAELVDAITSHEVKKIPYLKIKGSWNIPEIESFIGKYPNEYYVLKPNQLGASLFTEKISRNELLHTLQKYESYLDYDKEFLLQPHIMGREFTIGVVQHLNEVHVLPIVEIFTKEHFLGHAAKHTDKSAWVKIGELEDELKQKFEKHSAYIFKEIGFSNFCRFDYLLSDNKIYFLEANSIPGITSGSIFTQILAKTDITIPKMIGYFVENDLRKKEVKKSFRYVIAR